MINDDWNRPKAILERAEDDVDRVAPLELRDALRQALLERDEACGELEVLRGLIEGEPWVGAVLRRERDEARSVLREFFDASKNSVPYAQWPREMHEAARVLGDK